MLMSYEHCELHNEEATNGCAKCEASRRWRHAASVSLKFHDSDAQAIFDILMRARAETLEELHSLCGFDSLTD